MVPARRPSTSHPSRPAADRVAGAPGPTLARMASNSACLSCGARTSESVLSLGRTPLANAFLSVDDLGREEPHFALELVFCEKCCLVQLSERVPPETLFRNYIYVTGTSATMARHHDRLAREHQARLALGADSLVVDIASNDGSLLSVFRRLGTRTLGVEPSENLSAAANRDGIQTVNAFFGRDCAQTLVSAHGPASLTCANNVLAHVPDLPGFLEGLRILAGQDGTVSVEVPYLVHLLDRLEYDTIYHEHLSYFSVLALSAAFDRAGLGILELEHHDIHGGTIRVIARPEAQHAPIVAETCEREKQRGLDEPAVFIDFARRVARNRRDLRGLLEGLRDDGKKVGAYGAPAKGNTLLNYCGLGPDLISYTVDRNPLKVGKFTPGTRIPVLPQEHLAADRPDFALILPWNLCDEIVAQERDYRSNGGRFLVPIPVPRILA
ncbi:MAG: class I SAM-dependent methyltransferase [Acidobacteriota bacterium]